MLATVEGKGRKMQRAVLVTASVLAVLASSTRGALGGVHYSGERYAELPSAWRGLIADLRALRGIGWTQPGVAESPLRKSYYETAVRLEAAARDRPLSADEVSDLGALWLRLGNAPKAVHILREGQRKYPRHFAILANLGSAWQKTGDLSQAAEALRQAVALAPERWRKYEEYHLRLVTLRMREPPGTVALDDLFGVRFVADRGQYRAGQLAASERKKLPADAVAIAQQLALWMPDDARLIWLMAELANAQGDLRAASDLFDMCVGQYALAAPEARSHRAIVKQALTQAEKQLPGPTTAKAEHQAHVGLSVRSTRPLVIRRLDLSQLPPVTKSGDNALPWPLLMETSLDREFRPRFHPRLKELDGLRVSITGFMQPLTDDLEMNSFMLIEYPTGCWYCEAPEITAIVLVELPEDKNITYTRNMVKIVGTLKLNDRDPEDFLYTIRDARVSEVD